VTPAGVGPDPWRLRGGSVVATDGNSRRVGESRSINHKTAPQGADMITQPMTAELVAAHRATLLDEAATARLARRARPAAPVRAARRVFRRPAILRLRPVHV
jgi:hypothetical protein